MRFMLQNAFRSKSQVHPQENFEHQIEKIAKVLKKKIRNDYDCNILLNFLKKYSNQKYIFSQGNYNQYLSLLQSMQLSTFQPDYVIFSKGQVADNFYIILTGEIAIFEQNSQKVVKIITILGPVNSFGEKAFENAEKFRTFGAKSLVESKCLQIDGLQYVNNLSSLLIKQKRLLENYIEKYIPGTKVLAKVQKERMSYHFFLIKCRFDEVIIKQGTKCDCLYFVINGECILQND